MYKNVNDYNTAIMQCYNQLNVPNMFFHVNNQAREDIMWYNKCNFIVDSRWFLLQDIVLA